MHCLTVIRQAALMYTVRAHPRPAGGVVFVLAQKQVVAGLTQGADSVRQVVSEAKYMVLGLGDVYLGAPCAVPVDPR